MSTIEEDVDAPVNVLSAPAEDDIAQLMRRSLSIVDSDVGGANQTHTPKIRPVTTTPIVRIPTPSPRPSFVLVSTPTLDQTNTKTPDASVTASDTRPEPSLRSQEVRQTHSGSRDRPRQPNVDLTDILRRLATKERHFKGLKEQASAAERDLNAMRNMIQSLLDQGQSIPVLNQSSANSSKAAAHNHVPIVGKAIPSGKRRKEKKKKTNAPTSEVAVNVDANKGKQKEVVHATVAPAFTEPQREMTRAEHKAANQQQAMKRLPLGLAPVCPSMFWLLAGR
jgi:hypothetical protein